MGTLTKHYRKMFEKWAKNPGNALHMLKTTETSELSKVFMKKYKLTQHQAAGLAQRRMKLMDSVESLAIARDQWIGGGSIAAFGCQLPYIHPLEKRDKQGKQRMEKVHTPMPKACAPWVIDQNDDHVGVALQKYWLEIVPKGKTIRRLREIQAAETDPAEKDEIEEIILNL